jgi:hypothetical protein
LAAPVDKEFADYDGADLKERRRMLGLLFGCFIAGAIVGAIVDGVGGNAIVGFWIGAGGWFALNIVVQALRTAGAPEGERMKTWVNKPELDHRFQSNGEPASIGPERQDKQREGTMNADVARSEGFVATRLKNGIYEVVRPDGSTVVYSAKSEEHAEKSAAKDWRSQVVPSSEARESSQLTHRNEEKRKLRRYLESHGFDAEADLAAPENVEALKRALLEEDDHAISVRVNEPGALADLATFFERIGYPARETSPNTLEIEARHEGIENAQVRAAVELHVQAWLATRPNVRAELVA